MTQTESIANLDPCSKVESSHLTVSISTWCIMIWQIGTLLFCDRCQRTPNGLNSLNEKTMPRLQSNFPLSTRAFERKRYLPLGCLIKELGDLIRSLYWLSVSDACERSKWLPSEIADDSIHEVVQSIQVSVGHIRYIRTDVVRLLLTVHMADRYCPFLFAKLSPYPSVMSRCRRRHFGVWVLWTLTKMQVAPTECRV